MKSQQWLFLTLALVLMAGTAGALTWLRANQKLSDPGVKGTQIPGKMLMTIALPERVLDFTSTNVPEPDVAIGYFPKDTSYTERRYTNPTGIRIQNTVILMGADRTSIHRPEYCLPGQGWTIDKKEMLNIPINDNPPYNLQVARWNISATIQAPDGQKERAAGIYVFWYVAKDDETPDHDKMLEHLTMNLFRTGDLQRWAYISYYVPCLPGQEDAAFAETKRLIAAQVPQFELPLQQ
ncbi:MAG TPA: exosortase-associated EpsI family protein [Candidatus Sulfotelmatobacter sp.]|nr:exosortase-associated EpsI family protein [Candidatus Sulfotelmatobacter sp.]